MERYLKLNYYGINIINGLYLIDEKKKMLNRLSRKGLRERVIPLRLFFNMNEEHHIPLVALSDSEVVMHINFAEMSFYYGCRILVLT